MRPETQSYPSRSILKSDSYLFTAAYLGAWGSKESKDRYKQAIARWADEKDRDPSLAIVAAESLPESSTTLVELLVE